MPKTSNVDRLAKIVKAVNSYSLNLRCLIGSQYASALKTRAWQLVSNSGTWPSGSTVRDDTTVYQ